MTGYLDQNRSPLPNRNYDRFTGWSNPGAVTWFGDEYALPVQALRQNRQGTVAPGCRLASPLMMDGRCGL